MYVSKVTQVAKGSETDNRKYCSKEESRVHGPYSLGTPLADGEGQGSRSDLHAACELVKTKGLKAVAEEMPEVFVRCHNGLGKLEKMLEPKRCNRPMHVVVLVGPTGIGKSHQARVLCEYFGVEWFVPLLPSSRGQQLWLDNYRGEKGLILDEYEGQIPFTLLLRMLDSWTYHWQVKGASCLGLWELVVITSNSEPDSWYMADQITTAQRDAFHRRLNKVLVMSADAGQEHLENALIEKFCADADSGEPVEADVQRWKELSKKMS